MEKSLTSPLLLLAACLIGFTSCASDAEKRDTVIREIGELETRTSFDNMSDRQRDLFLEELVETVKKYPIADSVLAEMDSALHEPIPFSNSLLDLLAQSQQRVAREDTSGMRAFVNDNRKNLYRLTMLLIAERTRRLAFATKEDSLFNSKFRTAETLAPILDDTLGGFFLRTELADLAAQTVADARRKAAIQYCWLVSFYQMDDDLEVSLSLLARGLEKADKVRDKRLRLDILKNLQLALYKHIGRTETAITLGAQIIQKAKEIGYSRKQAIVHYYNADALITVGDYPGALKELREATTIYVQFGDNFMASELHERLSVVYRHLGDYDLALLHNHQAKTLSRQYRHRIINSCVIGEGLIFENLGQFERAKQAYLQGLERAVIERDSVNMSVALNNLGDLFFYIADYDSAISYFKQSLEINHSDPLRKANTLQLLLQTYIEIGDFAVADSIAYQVSKLLENYASLRLRAGYNQKNARLQRQIGQEHAALLSLQSALADYKKMQDISPQIECHCLVADAYRRMGRYDEAREHLDKAQELNEKHPWLAVEWMASYQEGLLSKDLGNVDDAVKYVNKAISSVENLAASVHGYEHRAGFSDRIRPIFEEMVQLQLQQKNADKAFDYSERERAHALTILLGADSTETPGAKQLVASLTPKAINNQPVNIMFNAAQLRAALAEDSVVLEYEVLDTVLVIWAIGPKMFEIEKVEIGRDELQEMISSFRQHFRPDSLNGLRKLQRSYEAVREIGKNLYRKLILPVAEHIATASTIYVVPDETLLYLPFAALVQPDDDFLISKFKLAYAPSAKILTLALEKEVNAGQQPTTATFLAIVHDHLKFGYEEAQAVARIFANSNVRMGSETNKETLTNLLNKSPQIVLFSTHGKNDDRKPANSFLNFRPQIEHGAESSLLRLPEILKLKMKETGLVYLAACESGTGKLYRGEGTISLQTAFLASGAETVVANMWQVDDKKSKQLTTAFFHGWLKQGLSRIAALRQAQLNLIDSLNSDGLYPAHPYFWASVTLNGVPN